MADQQDTITPPRKRFARSQEPSDVSRVTHLFDYDDRQAGAATGILSRLWRIMLSELNINNDNYPMLLGSYLDKRMRNGKKDSRAINTLRGNLNRQLAMPNMSFNVFLRALRVLRVDWIRIDITIGRGTKRTSHSIEVSDFDGYMTQYEQTVAEQEDDI